MTDAAPVWSVREYLKTDWDLVSNWWDAHAHGSHLVEPMLPPVGIIIEHDGQPACACWLYMAVGIGVCWVEHAVSRPGLKLREAKEAFRLAIHALEVIAKSHDYGVMIAHTLPAIARTLRGFGFMQDPRPKTSVVKLLNSHG